MVAKIAGGIIGLGLIGTGSVAMAKPEWFGINKETTWKPLSQDKDFTGDSTKGDYSNKFGSTYKNYLVGATKNQDWWNKIFDQLKKDSLDEDSTKKPSEKFKHTNNNNSKVSKGFSATDSDTALNQICKKVYKSESTNIDTNGSEANKYKEADVWKYCSGLGQKPKTVEEVDTGKYNDGDKTLIGKETSDRQKLISTTGNDKFWEIRNKEFKGDGYEKIETTEDKFFSTSKNKDIRTLCGEAYGLEATSNNTSEDNKPTKDQTLKYCSLDKSSQ